MMMEGSMMGKKDELVEKALTATTKEELLDLYSMWAGDYDNDLLDKMGYVAPFEASKVLQKYTQDKDAKIMDAGCGTGIVGQVLYQMGYTRVDGLDYSPAMLKEAGQKNVYASLSQGDLTSTLGIDDNSYDAVISVGTFTCAHVGPDALDELCRITRPGGHVCITVRDASWAEEDYHGKMNELSRAGKWQVKEEGEASYITAENSKCTICVFEILPLT